MTYKERALLWVYVDETIKKAIVALAELKGIGINEHLRSLVLDDLSRRGIFDDALAKKLAEAPTP